MASIRTSLALLAGGLCVLACLSPPAEALVSAGGGFYFQSMQPFGWTVGSLELSDSSDVWATTYDGYGSQIVHSENAGETWRAVDTGLDLDALHGLTFPDAGHARAATSWYDEDDAAQRVGLVASDDSGVTWTMTPIRTGSFDLYGAAFPSTSVALIAGYERNQADGKAHFVLLRTTNAGGSWSRRDLPRAPNHLTAIDATHLWLASTDHLIRTSADAGATWQARALPLTGDFTIDGLDAIDAKTAWVDVLKGAVPSHLILRTADGGRSWRRTASSAPGFEASLTALSGREAWLSVHADSLLRDESSYVEHTTDAGKTWSRRYVGPRSIGAVTASSDGGLIAGGDGLWRSTDAGASWSRLTGDPFSYWLNDVVVAGDGSLWAAGRSTPYAPSITGDDDLGIGLVYHCVDGVTWRRVEIPQVKPLRALDSVGPSILWAGGWDGDALRSLDGGASWTECGAARKFAFEDIEAVSGSAAVATAYDTSDGAFVILRTVNGGAEWVEAGRSGEGEVLSAISRFGADHLLIAGTKHEAVNRALLLESFDGGLTWERRLVACKRSVRDMTFADEMHGWIIASDGRGDVLHSTDYGSLVLRTVDGGASWKTTDLGKALSVNGLRVVSFADAKTGWLLGDRILKSSDGGVTWNDTRTAVPSAALGLFYTQPVIRGAATLGGDLWAVGADQLILSTVDTSADTAAPLTADDGDRLWHSSAVTTHFTASDPGGSGVSGIEYRIGDGSWQPLGGSGITIDAPADHSADGNHAIEYRSTDVAGNVEFPQLCTVHVDTRPPASKTLGTVRVRKGGIAKLAYRVVDPEPNGGQATVRITIRTASGNLAKRLYPGEQAVNERLAAAFRCRLQAGTYTYAVTATDAAGNPQSSIGRGRLLVTR